MATRAIRRRETFFLQCPRYISFFLRFSSSSAFYSSRLISSWRNLRTGFQMKSTRRAIDRSHDLRVYVHTCTRTYVYMCELARRKSEMGAVSCVLEKYQDPVRFRFVRSIKSAYIYVCVYACVCVCVCVCEGLLNREITSFCSRQILKNHKSNDSKETIRQKEKCGQLITSTSCVRCISCFLGWIKWNLSNENGGNSNSGRLVSGRVFSSTRATTGLA